MKELKMGTSWVRGVVGDALTPELIVNFSCAFGTWCDGGTVVIGHDPRRSSPMLRAAVVSGLLSTGCEVIDMGVCPSPVLSFAIRELGAGGGISITGGHNTARWNALKFIGPDGALLNAVKSEELHDLYHGSNYLLAAWDKIRAVSHDSSPEERYLEHLISALDCEQIRSRRFRVAVDFCNGSCGGITTRLLDALGCTLLPVNEQPSGEFAHPPAPSVANMQQLAAIMRWLKADLGAAINVDGDRIGFVTREGVALSEEYALPLAASIRLKRRPGRVATNLSTSRMIDTIAREHGQTVVRTPVGESHVIDQGLAEDAVLAGEGSGGIAALPTTMMFDGLLTLGFVLELMAATGDELSTLVERMPRYVMRKRQLECPPNLVYKVLDRFRARYADQAPNTSDGVAVTFDDAWLHVRSSNTEPLLRIIVEARTMERADALMEESFTFARRATYGHGGI